MESIKVRSTSLSTAVTNEIVLREKDTVRLVFKPLIVENPNNPEECLKGTFLYQRKKKDESWEDYKSASLQSIKAGEGYALELHSAEFLRFLKAISPIYRLANKHGVKTGTKEFIAADSDIASLVSKIGKDKGGLELLTKNYGKEVFQQSLIWLSQNLSALEQDPRLFTLTHEEIRNLESVFAITKMNASLASWASDLENGDEEFWQKKLTEYPWILAQAISYPVILFKDKAYVGGKSIDNCNGNIIDYLYKNKMTENSVLIEIKTPKTKILGAAYRGNSFSMSTDLTGGISQLHSYRDSIMRESADLLSKTPKDLRIYYPKCVLIIGNFKKEMDTATKIMAFENFRSQQVNMDIITFDEVLERISGIVQILKDCK